MSEAWLQEYIFLAFRLHRSAQTTYGSPFVEDYWGPPAWRKLVEAEPETIPADLVRQAMALADVLPVHRYKYCCHCDLFVPLIRSQGLS